MYKVFINERPIILTDSLFVESDFDLLNYKNTIISEIIHKLTEGNTKGIILLCADLQEAWGDFKSHFKVIIASGGLVINEQLEFLFIFRGGKWDLPKGRIEKGEQIKEAALREVKEECGISKLKLGEFLITTYHLGTCSEFNLPETTTKEVLIPQLEEGITIAIFKNKEDSVRALDNSYGNIHLVFKAYYQK